MKARSIDKKINIPVKQPFMFLSGCFLLFSHPGRLARLSQKAVIRRRMPQAQKSAAIWCKPSQMAASVFFRPLCNWVSSCPQFPESLNLPLANIVSKNSFLSPYMYRLFLPDTHKPEKSGNWIILARSHMVKRCAEKPATKAGQIRALWPEIDGALEGGQSMKSVRKWLEEDAGISVGITTLTSYISRLRRRDRANRHIGAPPTRSVREQTTVTPSPAPLSQRLPLSTPRQVSRERLHEDPLAQAMQALSKRPIDIREIHNDGDPNGRKLI